MKCRSNLVQKCEDSAHTAANRASEFDLNIIGNEKGGNDKSNDSQSTEGTFAAQTLGGPVTLPFTDQLKTAPLLDAMASTAVAKLRELLHQKCVEIKAALVAVEAIFNEFTEGEAIRALLQESSFVTISKNAYDNESEDTADIGLQRLAWANTEGEPMLKEVKARKPRVRTGRRRKSETGLLSGCPFD